MKKSNFAPAYAAMYPMIAEVARDHGYAVTIHGSLARDFDLVCIPWIKYPSDSRKVVNALVNEFSLTEIGDPEIKEHDREVFTLSIGFGECFLDLSFMPIIKN